MRLLDDVVSDAESRGLLPLRAETRWLRDAPVWLAELQAVGGFDRLETRLAFRIPAVIKEFWENPSLVRLLDSWRWADYLNREPAVVVWDHMSCLLVCSHPHSGLIGAVQLEAEPDPLFYWGWEDEDSPYKPSNERFLEHLRATVRRSPG
jgi:hypothetical protein